MSQSRPNPSSKRAFPTLERIDIICDAFESAWRSGRPPEIEEFVLSAAEGDRPEVLYELIQLDVEYRRKQGEAPTPAEYAERFSDYDIEFERAFANVDEPSTNVDAALDATVSMRYESLGVYQLLEKLGQGGMGSVYKARHTRLRRTVAVKVLSQEALRHPEALSRFQREMKIIGALDHPNIVRAMDADECDGTHFLAMEYVDGTDLSKLVKSRGPLPVVEAIGLIRQAAQGLAYAHEQGVVHRDIKPANLLVDAEGQLKILDMGLARLEKEIAQQSTELLLTRTDQVMGTFDYMSPEQAVGTRDVDRRTDIYSLGCTLHTLLVGKPMFSASSGVEKVMAHRNEPPPELHKARDDVSLPLNALFQRMVAKHPEDRFNSMDDVLAALDALSNPSQHDQTILWQPHPSEPEPAPLQPPDDTAPPKESGPKSVSKERPGSRYPLVTAGIVGGLLLLLTVPLFFAFPRNEGEVRFETDSFHVTVVVYSDDQLIDTVPLQAKRLTRVSLPAGNYQVRLRDGDWSHRIEGGEFRLDRGDQRLVRVLRVGQRERLTSDDWTWTPPVNLYGINSASHDTSPVVTSDGLLLMFASTRSRENLQHDIWFCERESPDQPWSNPQRVDEPINGADDNTNPSVSGDGLTLIFCSNRPGGAGYRDLWMSTRTSRDAAWGEPFNLGASVNTSAAEESATLSADGLTLIFSSIRQGTLGGFDLWQAIRPSTRARFGNATHLGDVINSSGNERSPCLSPDGLTLCFASDRRGGQGKSDIWMCLRENADSPWGVPFNLGPKINTPGDERSPTFDSEAGIIYFVAYGDGKALGGREVYASQRIPQRAVDQATVAQLVDPLAIPPIEAVASSDGESVDPAPEEDDAPPLAKFPFDAATAREHQKVWADYLQTSVERDFTIGEEVTMRMVLIPPGEFNMGTREGDELRRLEIELNALGDYDGSLRLREETPDHLVTLTRPFYLGKFEVTQSQWHKLMGEEEQELEHPDHPIADISWEQAEEFVNRVNELASSSDVRIRFPTEAQWEYACRAGSNTDFHFGHAKHELPEYGRFLAEDIDKPQDVGQLKPNPWGLHDMHGNVAEWCGDNYDRTYYRFSGRYDPQGPAFSTLRTVRGGSFRSRADQCRSRWRNGEKGEIGEDYIGLRLVATVPKD